MKWALLELFRSVGLRVQCFLSRACVPPRDGATAITGLPPRHLDSWLMGADTCRGLLLRGSRASELAVVEGALPPIGCPEGAAGGSWTTLCQWLDLPCLAIVDARQLTLPIARAAAALDGIILDGVRDAAEACRLQTTLEALWQVPVVGWLTASALRGRSTRFRREADRT